MSGRYSRRSNGSEAVKAATSGRRARAKRARIRPSEASGRARAVLAAVFVSDALRAMRGRRASTENSKDPRKSSSSLVSPNTKSKRAGARIDRAPARDGAQSYLLRAAKLLPGPIHMSRLDE